MVLSVWGLFPVSVLTSHADILIHFLMLQSWEQMGSCLTLFLSRRFPKMVFLSWNLSSTPFIRATSCWSVLCTWGAWGKRVCKIGWLSQGLPPLGQGLWSPKNTASSPWSPNHTLTHTGTLSKCLSLEIYILCICVASPAIVFFFFLNFQSIRKRVSMFIVISWLPWFPLVTIFREARRPGRGDGEEKRQLRKRGPVWGPQRSSPVPPRTSLWLPQMDHTMSRSCRVTLRDNSAVPGVVGCLPPSHHLSSSPGYLWLWAPLASTLQSEKNAREFCL